MKETFKVYDKLNSGYLGNYDVRRGETVPRTFKRKCNAFKYLDQEVKDRNLDASCFGVTNSKGIFVYR